MLKSLCLFLCLCYYVVGIYGGDTNNLVPFIDKCLWNDKACLLASTIKAMPYFADGLAELGMKPLDPLKIEKATLAEGDLKVLFTKMTVLGARNCKVLNVERDIEKSKLKISADCPIEVSGHYEASGKLLFADIEGNDVFRVNCQLIHIEVEIDLHVIVGEDGKNYWKIGKPIQSFEAKERCTFDFKNLFNGDEAKAAPVLAIFNESWKEILSSFGAPIVNEVITEIVNHIQIISTKVPADQLEKQ